MGIDVNNESGQPVDEVALSEQASFLLRRLKIHPLAELSVVLVDEPAMAELHVRWMDEPGPTDVMSFPMDELRPGGDDEEPEPGVLGDIVLCPQFAERQAEQAGHSRDDELAVLLTHGVLHLLGYDHAEPDEAREMFGLQAHLVAEWEGHRAQGFPP
ncbi:MAG: rRNA maturation RNase YbeY [Candidatus Nanopelagicales bacterium]